ncbi:MAG: 1-acyl-sn-glycerol-3-phosphate acyltransferase, partial [Vicinamibacteria bacterium]|nr:1-acyl-sn-glycerol-3-phosphate acyltransferase [Vicinamibacteria bacterium]
MTWSDGALEFFNRIAYTSLRFFMRMIFRLVYGLRIEGFEHVPRKGGALLVANHLSYIDPLFIAAALRRPVRFIMNEGHHRRLWLRPLSLLSRAIPLSSEMRPREMIGALRIAAESVRRGELVSELLGFGATSLLRRDLRVQQFALMVLA